MGLHAIDTVRRDAAERQIPFKTEQIDDNKVRVRVTDREVTLLYTIDLQVDVIDQIAVSTGDVEKGVLKFSYLQDIDDVGNEFVSPRTAGYQTPPQQAPGPGGDAGLLWLVQLAEGSLAK
jgi:hypothetical protein